MDLTSVLLRQLGISLLLGLLVGLQRERARAGVAGMRTFAFITVLGTVLALLAREFGAVILGAGLLGVGAVLILPGMFRQPPKDTPHGRTTDVAALLMYAVGALLAIDSMLPVAVAVGGGVAVLLQFKPELHRFAARLGDSDLRAIMQFVLITCIVLPVVPNRTFDPLSVVNPFKTWLMVVLIVGLELGGYIAYKFLGREAGILLGGVLGGAISSTATTVSYSQQSRETPGLVRGAAVVIMIASTVVFVRVLAVIAVVNLDLLPRMAGPMLAVMLLSAVPTAILWHRVSHEPPRIPEPQNPTHLGSAVMFGVIFTLVLFALAAARKYLGGQALYVVAVLSGLADVDAISLSTAQMALTDSYLAEEGWRLILAAILSNLVSKAVIVGLLGHRQLLRPVLGLFALPLLGGLAIVFLWP